GVAADGVTPLANGANGIYIPVGNDNVIGAASGGFTFIGATPDSPPSPGHAANVVANNGTLSSTPGSGVRVAGGTGNSIRGNSIYANVGLGIDLVSANGNKP